MPVSLRSYSPFAGSGTVPTVQLPSSYATDDFLLLLVETSNQATTLTGSGWTAITPAGVGTAATNTSTRLSMWWKRASSSETAPTLTDSGDHTSPLMLAFQDVDWTGGTPFDVVPATSTAGASTNFSGAGVTTTSANAYVVHAVSNVTDTNVAQFSGETNSNLANLTKLFDANLTIGNGGGITVIGGIKVSPGASGTTTGTFATSTAQSKIVFALKSNPTALVDAVVPTTTVVEGWPSGVVVSDIQGQLGSTWSLTNDAGGRFAISGSNLVTGSTATNATSATSHLITIRETNGGNTHDTDVTISVVAVSALWTTDHLAIPPKFELDGDDSGIVWSGSNLSSATLKGSDAPTASIDGTVTKASLNGHTGLIFDSGGERLRINLSAWGSTGESFFYAFVKAYPRSTGDFFYGILHKGSAGPSGVVDVTVDAANDGAGSGYSYSTGDGWEYATRGPTQDIGYPNVTNNVPTSYGVQLGLTNNFYANGVVPSGLFANSSENSTALFPNHGSAEWTLGEGWFGDSEVFTGEIYRLGALTYFPTTEDRDKIFASMHWRVGEHTRLNSSSPYRNTPPLHGIAAARRAPRHSFWI